MRLRLALLFSLICSTAFAQVTPGTSPLSGAKGGTNNAFMQFSGPATSLKTFTLPNASGTIDLLNAAQTFTAAKTFSDATLLLAGSSSGSTTLKASAVASGVLTLPAATDTLAALGQVQTWTGAQSYSDGKLILLGLTSGSSTLKAPATGGGTATLFPGSDTVMGVAAAQTPTNKTFNCANNTCTVRIASDVSGLATGVATFLGTPSSANLAAALTDETGSGAAVFASGASMSSLTLTTGFTATGLVTFADMATAAIATAAQYQSGAASVVVPASQIYQGEATITFGATTTIDMTTLTNGAVTLTGNITTMNVTAVAGKSGQIRLIQDGTGSRTSVFNSIFKFSGGAAPVLTTAASAVDALEYNCVTSSYCVASLIPNVK